MRPKPSGYFAGVQTGSVPTAAQRGIKIAPAVGPALDGVGSTRAQVAPPRLLRCRTGIAAPLIRLGGPICLHPDPLLKPMARSDVAQTPSDVGKPRSPHPSTPAGLGSPPRTPHRITPRLGGWGHGRASQRRQRAEGARGAERRARGSGRCRLRSLYTEECSLGGEGGAGAAAGAASRVLGLAGWRAAAVSASQRTEDASEESRRPGQRNPDALAKDPANGWLEARPNSQRLAGGTTWDGTGDDGEGLPRARRLPNS